MARYRTLLLRAWQVQDAESDHPLIWRYSAKAADAAEWQHFASLDELLAHLRSELGADREQTAQEEEAQ